METNPDRTKNPALSRYEGLGFGVYDVVPTAEGEDEARMVYPWKELSKKELPASS